jgi:hypothetical protein
VSARRAGPDGQPIFRALGYLKTDEVADVVQVVMVPGADFAAACPANATSRMVAPIAW